MKKTLKLSCAFLALSFVLLVVLYALRDPLLSPHLSRLIAESIESELGSEVQVGGISGTYFTGLSVHDIETVRSNPEGPVVSLDLKRLNLRYSLTSLFFGLDNFIRNTHIDIEGALLDLNLTGNNELTQPDQRFDVTVLPPALPRVRIYNSSVALKLGDAWTRFDGIDLDLRPAESAITRLNLAVPEWSWHHPILHDGSTSFRCAAHLTTSELIIDRLELAKGLIASSATIDLGMAPAAVPFEATINISDGRISLAGTWTEKHLEVQTSASRLNPAGITGIIRLPFSSVSGILDWRAEAKLTSTLTSAASAMLELTVSKGGINETVIEHIDLKARLEDEFLTIERMTASSSGSELAVTSVQAPASMLFTGDFGGVGSRVRGKFFLKSTDLPALLNAIGASPEAIPAGPAHNLLVQGEIETGTLSIHEGTLSTADGRLSVAPLKIQVPSAKNTWRHSKIDGAGSVDIGKLGTFGALFGFNDIGGQLKAKIALLGTLGAPVGVAEIDGKQISWRQLEVGKIAVRASANADSITIQTFDLREGPDRIYGEGVYNLTNNAIGASRLVLSIADIHRYLSVAATTANWHFLNKLSVRGKLTGNVRLNGPLSRPDGAADLKIEHLTLKDHLFGEAVLQIEKKGDRISSRRVSLKNGDDLVTVNGEINLSGRSARMLSLSARIADVGPYARGLGKPGWRASGKIQIQAQASGPFRQPDASIQADFNNFSFGGIEPVSAVLQARSAGNRIDLERVEIERPHERLKIAAAIENNWPAGSVTATVGTIDIQMHDLDLALEQPARVGYTSAKAISIEGLVLSGKSGSVSAEGTLNPSGSSDISLDIKNLSGSRWFELWAGDWARFSEMDATIRLSGSRNHPVVMAVGKAGSVMISGYPDSLSGMFDLTYARESLSIQSLSLRGDSGPDVFMRGNFPIRLEPGPKLMPGPISATGGFSIPDLRIINAFSKTVKATRGDLKGEFNLGGSWEIPEGRLMLQGQEVDFTTDRQPLPPGPYTFIGDLNLSGGRLTIQSLKLDSPTLTVTAQGRWNDMPPPATLLDPAGRKLTGDLEVEGRLIMPDMRWLARGVSSLRRTGGRLEAEMRLSGPISEPNYETEFRVSEGELQTTAGMPPFKGIQLLARMDTGGLKIEQFEARMGGSPVQASGSARWDWADPKAIDLSVKGSNLLLFRNESILVRADTDLKLQGPLENMALTGDLAVTKGLIKKNLNIFGALRGDTGPKTGPGIQLFSLTEPPYSKVRFDVRLTSTSPIDIRGNIAQGAVRPDLHLGGTGLLPVLTGQIYLDETRVNLPAGRLLIQSGVVQFLETDPEMPVLELNGRARMLGYDISAQVNGPYNEPEVNLSSIPPLPGDDLMLLLLTGQPPKDTLGKSGRHRQSIQVAVYVARDLFGGLFSNDSSEDIEDIIDRFDFEIGRDVTRSGDETINAQFRVANGLILKRDQLFITGEKDTYDYINTGVKLVFRFK